MKLALLSRVFSLAATALLLADLAALASVPASRLQDLFHLRQQILTNTLEPPLRSLLEDAVAAAAASATEETDTGGENAIPPTRYNYDKPEAASALSSLGKPSYFPQELRVKSVDITDSALEVRQFCTVNLQKGDGVLVAAALEDVVRLFLYKWSSGSGSGDIQISAPTTTGTLASSSGGEFVFLDDIALPDQHGVAKSSAQGEGELEAGVALTCGVRGSLYTVGAGGGRAQSFWHRNSTVRIFREQGFTRANVTTTIRDKVELPPISPSSTGILGRCAKQGKEGAAAAGVELQQAARVEADGEMSSGNEADADGSASCDSEQTSLATSSAAAAGMLPLFLAPERAVVRTSAASVGFVNLHNSTAAIVQVGSGSSGVDVARVAKLLRVDDRRALVVLNSGEIGLVASNVDAWVSAPCKFSADIVQATLYDSQQAAGSNYGNKKVYVFLALEERDRQRVVLVDVESCSVKWQLPQGVLPSTTTSSSDAENHDSPEAKNQFGNLRSPPSSRVAALKTFRWSGRKQVLGIFLQNPGRVLVYDFSSHRGVAWATGLVDAEEYLDVVVQHARKKKGAALHGMFVHYRAKGTRAPRVAYATVRDARGQELDVDAMAQHISRGRDGTSMEPSSLSSFLIDLIEGTPRVLVLGVMFALVLWWNLRKIHKTRQPDQEDADELQEKIRRVRESGRIVTPGNKVAQFQTPATGERAGVVGVQGDAPSDMTATFQQMRQELQELEANLQVMTDGAGLANICPPGDIGEDDLGEVEDHVSACAGVGPGQPEEMPGSTCSTEGLARPTEGTEGLLERSAPDSKIATGGLASEDEDHLVDS